MRVWPGKLLLDKTVILLVSCRQTWYFHSLQNNATQAPFLASTLPKDLVPNLGSGLPQPWRRRRYVDVGVSAGRLAEGDPLGR